MEVTASNFALRSDLWQIRGTGKLHPIPFHLQKIDTEEINYEISKNVWPSWILLCCDITSWSFLPTKLLSIITAGTSNVSTMPES